MTAPLAAALRHYRHAAGLSKAEAARRSGYSRSYLILLEKGRRHPSSFALSVLADVYGVTEEILRAWEPVRLYARVGPYVAVGDSLPRQLECVVGAPQMSAWEDLSAVRSAAGERA